MKMAIIGAGNIGTAMAALTGAFGSDVTVVARGQRLDAIRRDGVMLDDRGTLHSANVKAVTALESVQDVVFLCVKAHDLGSAVAANAGGIGAETLVVPMINGLPFWYFYGDAAPVEVPFTDPDGSIARHLRPGQVLGAVLLMTVQMTPAGSAVSTNTPTLSLSPVAGGGNPQAVAALVDRLNASGVRTDLAPDIRQQVLTKLLANLATNPLSALTGNNLAEIGRMPDLRAIAFTLADEFRTWAAQALGRELPPNDWLGDLLLDAGEFPTSMLQDARAGRRLELDAICRAPLALAGAGAMPALATLVGALEKADALPLTGAPRADAVERLLSFSSLERITQ